MVTLLMLKKQQKST